MLFIRKHILDQINGVCVNFKKRLISCEFVHSLWVNQGAFSWNFYRSSPTACASSLLNSLSTHFTIKLIQIFSSEEQSRREPLHRVSVDSRLYGCFLSMFPASNVSHTANKTHTKPSMHADENNNSEEMQMSQHEETISVNIITAGKFQISLRLKQ